MRGDGTSSTTRHPPPSSSSPPQALQLTAALLTRSSYPDSDLTSPFLLVTSIKTVPLSSEHSPQCRPFLGTEYARRPLTDSEFADRLVYKTTQNVVGPQHKTTSASARLNFTLSSQCPCGALVRPRPLHRVPSTQNRMNVPSCRQGLVSPSTIPWGPARASPALSQGQASHALFTRPWYIRLS